MDSNAWRKVYAMRSSSERSFKRIKNDYEIERCRVRSRKNWYFFINFAAMNCHLDAWVAKAEAVMLFVGCYHLPIIEDFDFAVFVPYNHLFSAILPGNAIPYAAEA
jgi:hypothetical protein